MSAALATSFTESQEKKVVQTTVRMPTALRKLLEDRVAARRFTPTQITIDGAIQEALGLWMDQEHSHAATPKAIEFHCQFCAAEYTIPVNSSRKSIVTKSPMIEAAAGADWILVEFAELLRDEDEKNIVEMITGYLEARRKARQSIPA